TIRIRGLTWRASLQRRSQADGRGVALRALFGDRSALDNVVDRLGDVGGVVAHPLDVLSAEHQVDAEGNVPRILHHIGEQFAEYRGADRVDLFVVTPHRNGFADVTASIGVQHLLELTEYHVGHVLDAANELGRRELAIKRNHALGDILGEIADPFQVISDPQRADDLAQIHGHWLTAGNGENPFFLDLALEIVDALIAGANVLRQRDVPLGQSIDRFRNLL